MSSSEEEFVLGPPPKRHRREFDGVIDVEEPFSEADHICIPVPFVEESFSEEFESSEFGDSSSDEKLDDRANNSIETQEGSDFSDCDSTNTGDNSLSNGIEIEFSSESCGIGEASWIEDELLDDISFLCEDYGNLKGMESEKLHGSTDVTILEALTKLFSWFTSSPGISKEAFSRLLAILHNTFLPAGNHLPDSYARALDVVQKQILLPVHKYDCCVNDCAIFRKSAKDFHECPQCQEPRYKKDSKVARKVFKYIPIGPHLKRMFANETLSHLLQNHVDSPDAPTLVSDLHQSPAWKDRFAPNGPFHGDPRGIALALCLDGMNPFSKDRIQYSMWPIVVTILNLPSSLRNVPGCMSLLGIIPGKTEPKNLDPYIEILVDKITELDGSIIYDGYQKEQFKLQIDIMLNIMDYPGQNKVFHCQGAGAYAGCAYCVQLGEYSKILQKMVYLGNRRFLPSDDCLRRDCRSFPGKHVEQRESPALKTTVYVANANADYVSAGSVKEKKELAQETGCKGPYSLEALPKHERFLSTPVEPMHLLKDIVEHCVKFVTGVEDSLKVRREEERYGRFKVSWVNNEDHLEGLPPAPFRLSKHEVLLADERAKSVLVPFGFRWRPQPFFSKPSTMKAHDWKQVATKGVLKFCLRGMLGSKQRKTLFALMDVLSELFREEIDVSEVDSIGHSVHQALALFERNFPVSLQVIVFHLLHHLPRYIKLYGPAYGFWMFPFERFNSWISRRVLNRRYPESTVIATYRVSEWVTFLESSAQVPSVSRTEKVSKIDVTLSDEQLLLLCSYYQSLIPEYRNLTQLYDAEREQAKRYHRLRTFPSPSLWHPKKKPPLTDTQRNILLGPSPEVKKIRHFSLQDSHGREVKFRTVESEGDHFCSHSSYVSAGSDDDELKIGRLVMLFEHTFQSCATTFGYVAWFDGSCICDPDTRLKYVDISSQSLSLLPASELSHPLVVAYDEIDNEKLWILAT